MHSAITCWGNYPIPQSPIEKNVYWQDQVNIFTQLPVLPYGNGRSYGDICFNSHHVMLKTRALDRFIHFDTEAGLLTCESSCLLSDILKITVKQGWMLPVVPGTQFVTVGGAIGNDVHGKNHVVRGTFGCHVVRFGLVRSDGMTYECSASQNAELFRATIGGLGLTGLILWAEIQLMRVESASLMTKTTEFYGLNEFLALSKASENQYEYCAAWLDCQSKGKNFARGVLIEANHAPNNFQREFHKRKQLTIPFFMPTRLLNTLSVRAFNAGYFYLNKQKNDKISLTDYDSFFFPLDSVKNWNRIYGRKGFFQYQCVVPFDHAIEVVSELLQVITRSQQASFLSVLKTFGNKVSPGYLSFPMPGVTLALDFPNRGKKTVDLLHQLDQIVISAKGRVYPAKDACMSTSAFNVYYGDGLEKWLPYKDPGFCSDFWRRVYNNHRS